MKKSSDIIECPIPIRKNFVNLTGKSFGKWNVIGFFGKRQRLKSYYYWKCVCECGTLTQVPGKHLRAGGSKSCGCDNPRSRTHGESQTSEYKTWGHMMDRCFKETDKAFKNYGGRGITVCERWKSVENFVKDMGRKPSPIHEIERVNNDGNYELSNCKWATPAEQNRNRRNVKWITIAGESMRIMDWAKLVGISTSAVLRRIKRGWTPKDAVLIPSKFRKRKSHVLHTIPSYALLSRSKA